MCAAGETPLYTGLLDEVTSGRVDAQTVRLSASRVMTGMR
jgi:hypothetical protein